ncbi:MAG: peptidase M3, partial [Calditrichia bacterium]
MKRTLLLIILVGLSLMGCSKTEQNPFFSEYDTPFQTPPFDKIKEAHYLPAFQKGIEQHNQQIQTIINNSESPTFPNTIEALEESGQLLTKVNDVFVNMRSANTSENLQKIAKEVSPLLSKHWDDILLNKDLFRRVKAVYDQKDQLDLDTEQNALLEKTYKEFVRGGANLDDAKMAELREINKELSLLSLKFGENVLRENNSFAMVIDNEADLAGLPEGVVSAASEAAAEK